MALRIATVELSDFDNQVATASLNAPGHDIVAPPRSSARPVTPCSEAAGRGRRFLEDPTARWLRVCLEETLPSSSWYGWPSGTITSAATHMSVRGSCEMAPLACSGSTPKTWESYRLPNFSESV